MMHRVFEDIDASDLLIAEVSHKAIGVGIEAGFAAAKGIPVIYLRQSGAEYSTTLGGLASHAVIYTSPGDLHTLLPSVLKRFDLPDCYRELKAKKLRQIEPWGANPS